jgi:hypothetical protein
MSSSDLCDLILIFNGFELVISLLAGFGQILSEQLSDLMRS